MKLKDNKVTLQGLDGEISIKRNEFGIPEIDAGNMRDIQYGLGWVQATDRQMQVLLTRILIRGRASECLAGDAAMLEVDRYMRLMQFLPDPQAEIAKLQPQVRDEVEAYCAGFNQCVQENGVCWEMKLLGYQPEPLDITDCILLAKVFCFVGLLDSQLGAQRLLAQMIQNDVSEAKLRDLFPYLSEEIDYDLIKQIELTPPLIPEAIKWMGKLPKAQASNNWVTSGSITANGNAFLCGDPHLEVNRLPSVWQEIVMRVPDNTLAGVVIPGLPGLILGRTNDVAWSATYTFMDMLDWRIEKCENGMYWREDGWKPFEVHEEVILVKKGEPVTMRIYENEHGIVEGDPNEPGLKLVLNWSAHNGCGAGDLNGLLNLPNCKTVAEAQDCFKLLDAVSQNFAIADSSGNIGYQMTGRMFQRAPGVSGMVPLPGWEEKYNHLGFVDKDRLPKAFNPDEGYIVTANQDLNYLGDCQPINLPMAPYRTQRIAQLLEQNKGKLDEGVFQTMHMDLHSVQAERFMPLIKPLLPDTPNGKILADWDCGYQADSKGAMLFEEVYHALVRVVFGDGGMGRDVIDYMLKETGAFNDFYGNFDDVIEKEDSAWFLALPREEAIKQALKEGLGATAQRYGSTRKIMLSHLLFGGKFPSWLGFDYGPIELPGGKATIPQGQIFNSAGRTTSFSPSLRMIADMGRKDMLIALAGGPSDRRFSKYYKNGVAGWLKGEYKRIG